MSITSRITSMEEHIEQAYDELQGLGADLTNVNKNIENISMVLDDIYDSMPQVSGEGTSLTLDNTRVGKIKSTLKGNTSQTGTPTPTSPIPVNVVSGDNSVVVCGEQLFNINDTGNGYFTDNSGSLNTSIDGFHTNDYIDVRNNAKIYGRFEALKDIRIARFWVQEYDANKTSLSRTSIGIYDTTFTTNQVKKFNITLNENTKYIRLGTYSLSELVDGSYVAKSPTKDEWNNYVKTTISFTDSDVYEPYQGNTYNIDLPVENLLPNLATSFDTTNNGVTKKGENGTYRVYGTATGAFYGVNNALVNNYTIKSGDYLHLCNNSVVSNITIVFYTTNSNFSYEPNAINRIVDLSSYIGETITGIGFYTNASFNGDVTFTPMILQTNKQNSYTPYGTTPIELCSSQDGTKRDYLLHDKTLDKWYWHREIGKAIADGDEYITIYNYNTARTVFMIRDFLIGVEEYTDSAFIPNLLSNRFIKASQSATWVVGSISRRNIAAEREILYVTYEPDTSIDNFKTWLASNNLTCYYVYATPTYTEITYQPLIDQLNLLEKAMSKDGQTNISQVNNDLPFIISASALKEWQESASLNSTLSMVNPLSLGNTLNTQENNTQPIEVDNIEPLEEEENEES